MEDFTEHDRARARSLRDVLAAGWKADGIVGAMGRASVPIGRLVAPAATFEQALRILREEIDNVVALFDEEEAIAEYDRLEAAGREEGPR